ncbi:MAG: hypothetical protein CVU44_01445 [Chloroflexi bacterium HGW-Chloroflexi-6]|nr:MAG: hypothetical protein CVU44_01445 [Chloroflexi bacterium HGW-Chloroflexi-6]
MKKLPVILLTIISVVWALVIVPCGALALFTVFLADGQIDPNAFALIFFGSLSFPVAIVIFTPLAWVAYYFKKNILAIGLGLLPLITLIFPILGFALL